MIINRAKSERFRPTLCGVVAQLGQFSFVRGGVVPAMWIIRNGNVLWRSGSYRAQRWLG